MKIDLCTLDWAAISAIATGLMAFVTFRTLTQNRRQLEELKRQWHDEHKAKLVFSVAVVNDYWYCLKIQNVGKAIAENITFTINEKFIETLLLSSSKENLLSFSQRPLTIPPNQCKLFMISPTYGDHYGHGNSQGQIYTPKEVNAQLDEIMNLPIEITGVYNKTEVISESFTMDSFFRHSIAEKDKVVMQLEKIVEIIKKQSR